MKPLPEALKAPITNLDEAKAWIAGLLAADLAYHFEDDATDCLEGLISQKNAKLVNQRVQELYALEWGPRPGMGQWYCPIGYLMSLEPFNKYNQAEGCLPGMVEVDRSGNLRLLDREHTSDYDYGAPGRFVVVEVEDDGRTAYYATPDEARAAHPALQASLDIAMVVTRAAMGR